MIWETEDTPAITWFLSLERMCCRWCGMDSISRTAHTRSLSESHRLGEPATVELKVSNLYSSVITAFVLCPAFVLVKVWAPCFRHVMRTTSRVVHEVKVSALKTWLYASIGCLVVAVFAFDRTHTMYVVFQSRGFYDVPRVLVADARSFQALATILDWLTHLPSISC